MSEGNSDLARVGTRTPRALGAGRLSFRGGRTRRSATVASSGRLDTIAMCRGSASSMGSRSRCSLSITRRRISMRGMPSMKLWS
jgi:hypothetical protein